MAELYWMALLRNRNFNDLDPAKPLEESHQDVRDAVADLNKFSWFASLSGTGPITKSNFLRAQLPMQKKGFTGVDVGPYLSQFLLRGTIDAGIKDELPNGPERGVVNFGSLRLSQMQRTVLPNRNFLINPTPNTQDQGGLDEWFNVQNGRRKNIGKDDFDKDNLYFIRTLRDGANYVHFDQIYQEYLIAASILLSEIPRLGDTKRARERLEEAMAARTPLSTEDTAAPFRSEGGINAPDLLNIGNPYRKSKAQVGFATFGVTHILTLLAEVSTRAHKAGWYHKWRLRRIRPEEYAARIDANLRKQTKYDLPPELLSATNQDSGQGASVLAKIYQLNENKSYLLPQAFPEGCPTHPAYPSGHATVAGASVTVLKALFNGEYKLTGSEQPAYSVNASGKGLKPCPSIELTTEGELNKLASDITYFRAFAGVHWTSDNVEGMLLGERVAIELLIEQTVSSTRDKHAPFYRERLLDTDLIRAVGSSAPFFRLTTFADKTIDISEGTIFIVERTAEPQVTWKRMPKTYTYEKFEQAHYGLE